MGSNASSIDEYEATKEKPIKGVDATLYYFAGRGLADPIRWVLAAANISFGQKVVDTREHFLKMAARQLPFGALPMLQIDGIEMVQSRAIIRAIAKRSRLCGRDNEEEIKCDMIAEMCDDVLSLAVKAPFVRNNGQEAGDKHIQSMKEHWMKYAPRFEAVLAANGGSFMVGDRMTYADVLMVHCLTCYVEEVRMCIFISIELFLCFTYRYTYTKHIFYCSVDLELLKICRCWSICSIVSFHYHKSKHLSRIMSYIIQLVMQLIVNKLVQF